MNILMHLNSLNGSELSFTFENHYELFIDNLLELYKDRYSSESNFFLIIIS